MPHLTKKGEQQDCDVTMIGYALVFAECFISSGVWTSLCGMFFCQCHKNQILLVSAFFLHRNTGCFSGRTLGTVFPVEISLKKRNTFRFIPLFWFLLKKLVLSHLAKNSHRFFHTNGKCSKLLKLCSSCFRLLGLNSWHSATQKFSKQVRKVTPCLHFSCC